MQRLAHLVTKLEVAWAIVIAVAVLTAVCLVFAGQLKQEDDLLAFLPQDNADIAMFQAINKEFGGLDAALVGIETDDVFDPDFLERVQRVTAGLQALPNLDHVLSITSLQDFSPDPLGGVRAEMLIPRIPSTPEEQAALRAHVLSRDHVRGSLVSEDGKAIVLVAFAVYRSDPQKVSGDIRSIVEPLFPDEALYWGGSPFISTYIFQTTQADLARLSPWAVVAIIVIMIASFRDLLGTALALVSTGIGILVSRAAMAALGIPLNIVLGSMPIILFAVGSAYAIHMLSRYQAHARVLDCPAAVYETMVSTGPVVFTAGLTTAVGLLSFVCMDIEPLRIFGIFTAVGIIATLVLSLTFVPAVIRIAGLRGGRSGSTMLAKGTCIGIISVLRWRRTLLALLGVVTVVGAVLSSRVDTRVDQSAFYSPDSPPDRSDRFLTERFGGAHFIQVLAEGDLRDPVVLRRVRSIADEITSLDHVARVQHIGRPVSLLNQMMEGQPRIPDTRAKVETLFGFLTGNPSVRQLANEAREKTLMHVQIGTTHVDEVDALLEQIETIIAREDARPFSVAPVDSPEARRALTREVAANVARLLARHGVVRPLESLSEAIDAEGGTVPSAPARALVIGHLTSAESLVPVGADVAADMADALIALGANPATDDVDSVVATALGKPVDDALVADLAWSVGTPLKEAWANAIAIHRVGLLVEAVGGIAEAGDAEATVREALAVALLDRGVPTVAIDDPMAEPALRWTVSGLPVMHRGLSRSVTANQLGSLAFALSLVAVILSIAFRSVRAGLLATAPTALALLIIYGGMGLMGIHLDIGTSMLASIIIGAGVDYAVHLLSAWHAREGEDLIWGAARAIVRVGPAVWTNALMVAVGFFVLTLGEARPLKNVGGLTAAAMIVAALATFLVIPVLARRRNYRSIIEADDPADSQLVGLTISKTAP